MFNCGDNFFGLALLVAAAAARSRGRSEQRPGRAGCAQYFVLQILTFAVPKVVKTTRSIGLLHVNLFHHLFY